MRLPLLVRLVRPVLAPTAAADVFAAAGAAGGAGAGPLALAAAGSMCLYAAGMVHNDLCDRHRDAVLHPDRPLVAHPGLFVPAVFLALGLAAAGLVLAAWAGALLPALAVVAAAGAYNAGLKRVFPADLAAMGGARAANLSLGFAVAGAGAGTTTILYAGAYLLFIAGVTGASRAEDLDPPPTRRLALLLATLLLLAALGVLAFAAKRFVFRCLLLIFGVHACVLFAARDGAGLVPLAGCAAASFFLLALLAPPPPKDAATPTAEG